MAGGFGTSFHQNIYSTLLYTPAIRRLHEIQADALPLAPKNAEDRVVLFFSIMLCIVH